MRRNFFSILGVPQKPVQQFDALLGILLVFMVPILFMSASLDERVLVMLVGGLLCLWASQTTKEFLVYIINLFIGITLILGLILFAYPLD